MAADPLILTEALLAELDAIHERIQAADERTLEAVTRTAAIRNVLRHQRRQDSDGGGDGE